MNTIVIATDGSPSSAEALDVGIDLARRSGAQAVAVYVRRAPSSALGDPFYQQRLSRELKRADAVVAEVERRARTAGVDVEPEVLEGDPAEQVVELARRRDADLIVVGSRGLGPVAGALLGSVSGAIVSRADRSVLVVKPRLRRLAA